MLQTILVCVEMAHDWHYSSGLLELILNVLLKGEQQLPEQ